MGIEPEDKEVKKILSVSIASYNVEKTLQRAVNSVLAEKKCLQDIEIIIVNDGSKDKTTEIAKEYVDKYPDIVILIDKNNGGYGSTINASLAVARGKYFKLLDGDDAFVSENLSDYICFLKKHSEDIVISPYYEIYEKAGEVFFIDKHKASLKSSKAENIVMHEIAVNTEMLRTIGTHITEHCFYTDNEFVFYALLGGCSFANFSKPIYNYYLGISGQSVSVEGIRRHYKDMIAVSNKLCDLFSMYLASQDNEKTKRRRLEDKMQVVVRNVYGSFLMMECTKFNKDELRCFDLKLKNCYPEVYKQGEKN